MRLFLLTALLFMLCQFSHAQIRLGAKAGYSASNKLWKPSYESLTQMENKSSVVAGIISDFQISQKFALQAELLYSQRGVADQVRRNNTVRVSHTYLSLPITMKFYPVPNAYLEAGLETSLVSGGDSDPQNKIDLAPALGLGYELLGRFPIGFRYLHGLGRIETITVQDLFGNVIEEGYAKNRSLQVTLGYYFLRGKGSN